MHRHKVLKDEDLVPDDTVDNGEQDQVHEVLSEEGLDLSYLWMVNVNNLGPPSRPTSNTERSSNSATKGRGTIATTDVQVRCPDADWVGYKVRHALIIGRLRILEPRLI